jgi:hypothetical protein
MHAETLQKKPRKVISSIKCRPFATTCRHLLPIANTLVLLEARLLADSAAVLLPLALAAGEQRLTIEAVFGTATTAHVGWPHLPADERGFRGLVFLVFFGICSDETFRPEVVRRVFVPVRPIAQSQLHHVKGVAHEPGGAVTLDEQLFEVTLELAAESHGTGTKKHELIAVVASMESSKLVVVVVSFHLGFPLFHQLAQDTAVKMLTDKVDISALAGMKGEDGVVVVFVDASRVVGFAGASVLRLGLLLLCFLFGLALQRCEAGGFVEVADQIEVPFRLPEVVAETQVSPVP